MSVWPPDLLIFCKIYPRAVDIDFVSHCFSRRLCSSASNYTDQKNAIAIGNLG